MSLSRELASLNDEQFRAAMAKLAKEQRFTTRASFDDFLHNQVFRNLHRGGFDQEKLKQWRKVAREEYWKANPPRP